MVQNHQEVQEEVLTQALGALSLEQVRTSTAQYTSSIAVVASRTGTVRSTVVAHLERSYQAPAVPNPSEQHQPPVFAKAWEGRFGVVLIAHSESGSTKSNTFEQQLVQEVLKAAGQGQVREDMQLVGVSNSYCILQLCW
jgi:tripartite-type tricarboxylate transporter receptor subunit TctC